MARCLIGLVCFRGDTSPIHMRITEIYHVLLLGKNAERANASSTLRYPTEATPTDRCPAGFASQLLSPTFRFPR